jgi:hypothetical protein
LTPSYELQLMALAVLLYVYDCAVLLYANEGLLIGGPTWPRRSPNASAHWRAVCPRGLVQLGGRFLYLENPLMPQRPAFRLSWSFAADAGPGDSIRAPDGATGFTPPAVIATTGPAGPAGLAESLTVLTPFVATAAVALYVLLPLGLFSPLGAGALVPALVLLYGSITAALGVVYLRRAALALARGQCAVLAFECLACPPFGVNLVRRIALAKRCAVPFPDAAVCLLEPLRWQALERELEAQLGEELAAVERSDAARTGLEAQIRRLRALESGTRGRAA